MGTRTEDRTPLAWQATLAGMVANGVRVRRSCTARACGRGEEVNLAAMLDAEGPQATLWNRRPACPHCGERGHYMASPGPSTPYTPLLSGQLWDEARRRFLKSFGFTRRDITRIKAMAEATHHGYVPKALNDLDVPVRVGACMPGQESYSSGRPLGEWAGRTLLYWDMNAREEELWRKARRSGPKPVPSAR